MDNTPQRIGGYLEPTTPAQRTRTPQSDLVRALKAPLAVAASLPNAGEVDEALQRAWARIFSNAGLSVDEVTNAFDVFFERNKWFPAPCEIIEIAKAARPPKVFRPDNREALPERKREPLSKEQRMAILAKGGKLGAAVIERLEGVKTDEEIAAAATITDEDLANRDEQIRKLREA